ncbi:MAG: DUF2141 domain-containing protein [Bacteroidales bacterium]
MKHISASHILNGRTLLPLLLLTFLCQRATGQEDLHTTGKLIITFTEIRSGVGNIAMGLYDAEDQWTDDPLHNYAWDKGVLRNGKITIEIDSLPIARYACAVLDDEDCSFSMNYLLGGLPVEGWGMSNNPPFLKLKKPAFREVSFDLAQQVTRIEIKMNYLNRRKKVE